MSYRNRRYPTHQRLRPSRQSVGLSGIQVPGRDNLSYYRGVGTEGLSGDIFGFVKKAWDGASKWTQQRLGIYKKPFFKTWLGSAVLTILWVGPGGLSPGLLSSWVQKRLGYYKKPFLQTTFGRVMVGQFAVGAIVGLSIVAAGGGAMITFAELKAGLGYAGTALAGAIKAADKGQWYAKLKDVLYRITKLSNDSEPILEAMGIADPMADPVQYAIDKATEKSQDFINDKIREGKEKVQQEVEEQVKQGIKDIMPSQPAPIPVPNSTDIYNATPLPGLGLLPTPTPLPLGASISVPGGTAPIVVNQGGGQETGQAVKLPDTFNAKLVNGKYEVQTEQTSPLALVGLAITAISLLKGKGR
jgi:hypothetical protein